jgi:4-hydroxybenzoate polyprenyltransferase
VLEPVPPTAFGRLVGVVRLAHPFPSILDGLVTAIVALVASRDPAVAVRLGLSMVALQVSIGILNDLIDAPRDAGRTPPKPIPSGLVTPGIARIGAIVAAVVGIALAVPSGWATTALAVVILGIGYGYDQFAKGTAWSWLPFALGIPLLPVFGWLGAVGELPSFFAILLPVAVLAGAALAIANALADLERDTDAGVESVARRLGRERAWTVHAYLLWAVLIVAYASLIAVSAHSLAIGGATVGSVLVAYAASMGREGGPERRQRMWELEAVGIAMLAVAWLAGIVTAPA